MQVWPFYGQIPEIWPFFNLLGHKTIVWPFDLFLIWIFSGWEERHEAVSTFIQLYDAVVLTLNQISKWSATANSSKAVSLLAAVTAFGFVVSLQSAASILSCTRPLAVKLQTENQDILGAMNLIKAVVETLSQRRKNAEINFRSVYVDASSMIGRNTTQESSLKEQATTAKNFIAAQSIFHYLTTCCIISDRGLQSIHKRRWISLDFFLAILKITI